MNIEYIQILAKNNGQQGRQEVDQTKVKLANL